MYKYTKLTQHLKHLIETGELKPHEKLPSLRDQMQRSGLSLMTVLNAYRLQGIGECVGGIEMGISFIQFSKLVRMFF